MFWSVFFGITTVLLLVLCILLVFILVKTITRVQIMERAQSGLSDNIQIDNTGLYIQLKDPLKVAAQQNKWGRIAGKLLPSKVIQRVYEELQSELSQAITERDIEANLQITQLRPLKMD